MSESIRMETKIKKSYETPTVLTVEVKLDSVLLQMSQQDYRSVILDEV